MSPSRAASLLTEEPQPLLRELRQQLAMAEGTTGLGGEHRASVKLGIGVIDAALGGGLACGTLHEFAAARETETPAAAAFALAITACLLRPSCRFANRPSAGHTP